MSRRLTPAEARQMVGLRKKFIPRSGEPRRTVELRKTWVMEQKKAGSRIAAMDRPMPIEQHFDFEKPMSFTPVGPMGQHPPEISRAIHEECLEDKNDAAATYRTDADDGGGRG